MTKFGVILFAAVSFLLPCTVAADTLPEIVSIGFSGQSIQSFLKPFDHTLGTLTSVDVMITGDLSATALTQPNFVFDGNGLIPVPQPFSVSVDLNFFGISGGSFFKFFQPATFYLNGISTGAGGSQYLDTFFNLGFKIDSSTDIAGLAPAGGPGPLIPPIFAIGTLASFTDNFSPFMTEFMLTTPGRLGNTNASLISSSADGEIFVQYNYTPASTAVPEPGTLLMLAIGLLGITAGLRALRLSGYGF